MLLVFFIFFFYIEGKGGIKEKAEEKISEILSQDVELHFKKIDIDPKIKKKIEKSFKQRFYKSWLYSWEIKNNNQTIALALLDNVYGKSSPFTFVTVFDLKGNILGIRIVKYREPHGHEVKNKKWLANFIGKNSSSSFVKGQDIDGISGATIS